MEKKMLGRVLIWMGVLAWMPYFYLKLIAGTQPPLLPFLIVHLIGVLGGGALKGRRWLRTWRTRED